MSREEIYLEVGKTLGAIAESDRQNTQVMRGLCMKLEEIRAAMRVYSEKAEKIDDKLDAILLGQAESRRTDREILALVSKVAGIVTAIAIALLGAAKVSGII